MDLLTVLKATNFGNRTAEEEKDRLQSYFVETEQWRKVINDEIDIVYGPKGSGKSAIYNLIIKNVDTLFDKNILVTAAENPQGAPAFAQLESNPPRDESEFVFLWKCYFLTLCGQTFREYGIKGAKSARVISELERASLLPSEFSLSKALKYVFDYVKAWRPKVDAIETTYTTDQSGTVPVVTGKIYFKEPDAAAAKLGAVSVDELLRDANDALKENGYSIWILLDRLDVAFPDSFETETLALRSLFRFYLDCKHLNNIRTKIFLRSDIWAAITETGFREASHIERSLTIDWKEPDILNLIVRRVLSNQAIVEFAEAVPEKILADANAQKDFIEVVFPRQVETGPNKPTTFAWLLGRTKDSSRSTAPREIVHFLNELRDTQILRLERGEKGPTEKRLFEQVAFKDALPAVSQVRLEQTLFAEFPKYKPYIEALREQKATQSLENLTELWKVDAAVASEIAAKLEGIGFFEKFGGNWRVPFLYRPALNLVQGAAD